MEPLVPHDHNTEEDESYADFRFVFYPDGANLNEDGSPGTLIGQIESHFHHVDERAIVDALLIAARTIVTAGMERNMFSEDVPEEVRTTAATMLANNWLTDRLRQGEALKVQPIEFSVPDDLSGFTG